LVGDLAQGHYFLWIQFFYFCNDLMDASSLGKRSVAGPYEHGNEPSGSIKGGE
jgi:hypothetical protein